MASELTQSFQRLCTNGCISVSRQLSSAEFASTVQEFLQTQFQNPRFISFFCAVADEEMVVSAGRRGWREETRGILKARSRSVSIETKDSYVPDEHRR